MNRRGFVGTVLAGLGGLFLPIKSLFAKDIDTISSEKLWMEISSIKQHGVKIFLHKPTASKGSGLSTTHRYDFLKDYCVDEERGISFGFKDHIQEFGYVSIRGYTHPTSNMKYISVCPEKDCYEDDLIFYEHHGDDCWSKIANKTIMPWIKDV